MDHDVNMLIQQIRSGKQEVMDEAAQIICWQKDDKTIQSLIALTYDNNFIVRGIAAICLGVMGDPVGLKALKRLKKIDKDGNVRLAAFLALKHFGKLSYEEIKVELHSHVVFPEEEIFPTKPRPTKDKKQPSFLSRIPFLGRFPVYTREFQLLIIVSVLLVPLVMILLINIIDEGIKIKRMEIPPPKKEQSIGEKLIKRNRDIANFKNDNLNPSNPECKLPKTMVMTTHGDVLKDLTDQVYGTPQFEKAGKNTLLSSWRKMNFKTGRRDRRDSLMYEISTNEQLIFPNPSAMHMKYNIGEGTVAYEAIENSDPDLEIIVVVEKVTLE